MTKEDLTKLFERKTKLFEAEKTLKSLRDALSFSDDAESAVNSIANLEKKIFSEKAAVAELTTAAYGALMAVDDDVARMGAMLHYCEGMPWSIASFVLKISSANAAKEAAYRGLRRAGIK